MALGYDDAAGMGLALGGDVMSQIGAAQGAKALSAQEQQQLAAQLAFQQQANQQMGLAITNNNPTAVAQRFGIQTSQPGQAYLANLSKTASPMMSAGAGKAFTQRAGQGQANLQGAQTRLRQLAGMNRGAQQQQQGQAIMGSQLGLIRQKAQQAQTLYPLADQVAAGSGMGLRMGGQLMSGLGQSGAGGGAQGMSQMFAQGL
jgi:hypothetical protein